VRCPALAVWLFLALGACGKQEAADPKDVLGDDMNYGGVNGRTGDTVAPKAATGPDAARAAEPDECKAAADHLVDFAIERAIQEETDPAAKQRLETERQRGDESEVLRKMRAQWSQEWTQECLDRGDTRGEVRCILAATREADLERCAPAE
jgi:hypothetical protein